VIPSDVGFFPMYMFLADAESLLISIEADCKEVKDTQEKSHITESS